MLKCTQTLENVTYTICTQFNLYLNLIIPSIISFLSLTLYDTIPGLNYLGDSLLKTLWKKEKMLEASIFFFPNNIFYSVKDNSKQLTNIYFVRAPAVDCQWRQMQKF